MKTLPKKFLTYSLLTFLAIILSTTLFSHTCSAYVYWANYLGNTIGRANLDGSGSTQNWITGCDRPFGVAINANYVYWANYNGNTIGRANLDGSGSTQNWITGCNGPTGVAVDANYVYWANYTAGTSTIGRANLDGSGITQNWITGCDHPVGVAVDANYVYWANYAVAGTIGRANLDGSGITQNWITGCDHPDGVAVDANYVYWAENAPNTIGRANLDGSGIDQDWITGCDSPNGVAVDANYVYWANYTSPGTIGRANLDGSGVTQNWIAGCCNMPAHITVTPFTMATGTPSSYQVTVTKVEMYNGTSWVEIFSGTTGLDLVAGGTFPGISNLHLPAGTYSQVRVTFNNNFPVSGMATYSGTPYYTTGTTFSGQTNLASTPTTVAGDVASFTFRNPAWGALDVNVEQTFGITPVTVGGWTDYQPTLRFTISDTLLLKGTAGSPASYYLTTGAPTVSIVEP